MADDIKKEYDRAGNKFKVSNSIYEESGKVIKPANPDASSLRRLSKGATTGGGTGSVPLEVLTSIVQSQGVAGGHGISSKVTNLNPRFNPAQYTANVLNNLKGKSGVIFSADTEWLGGGSMPYASPVELGIQPIVMSNGAVSAIPESQRLTLAVQLSDNDATQIRALINKVKSSYTQGRMPDITQDEYRTLKDLINYAGKDTIDPVGIITRSSKNALVDRQSLAAFLPEIEDGFNALNPKNKASRAVKRSAVGTRVNQEMMKFGYTLSSDPTFVWHNGLGGGSDIDVWNKSYGSKDVAGIFGFKGKATHLDTLSWIRATEQNALGLHKGAGKIQGPLTLSSLSESLLGHRYEAHIAGQDATAGAKLFEHLWKNGKPIEVSSKNFTSKSKLFSTGSIMRTANSPLDYAIEYVDGKVVPRDYQAISTYKNALHRIQNEFEYNYGGRQYFGVILHNVDDNIYSVVARENVRDLQNVIQQNFLNMDEVANSKQHKAIRDYVTKTRSRREYNNMFRGKSAYANFNKYVSAYEQITATGGAKIYRGALTKATVDKLVQDKILTKSQAEKFAYMFPRMRSEYNIFQELRPHLQKLSTDDQRATALTLFKQRVDELAPHQTNITLPGQIYKQSRIYDPLTREFKTVDIRSPHQLAGNIRNIVTNNGGNPNMGFADAKHNMRQMVFYMGHEGTIAGTKARKLIRTIDKVAPYHGKGNQMRGIHDMAMDIATSIIDDLGKNPYNVLEGQEDLSARPSGRLLETLRANNTFDDITNRAIRYFSPDGSLTMFDNRLEAKLSGVDDYIRKYVSQFSPAVAQDPFNLGPVSTMDSLKSMVDRFSAVSEGKVAVDVRLAEGRGNHGLIMSIYDSSTATALVNTKRKTAAEIFIPLVDPDTGLLKANGIQSVNILKPIIDKKTGRARINTYQNNVFDVLKWNAQDITDMVASGDTYGATKLAKNNMSWSLRGVPSGTRYNINEIVNELTASTSLANRVRSGRIDFNHLIYQKTGKAFGNISDGENFLRTMLYDDNTLKRLGIDKNKHTSAAEISNIVRSQLGLNFNTSGLKGESVQKAMASVDAVDPRIFGAFGFFSDPGRENAKQALNYYPMGMDDIVTSRLDGTKSYASRASRLASLDPKSRKRLTGKLVATESYFANADFKALNINTLFVNDVDIYNLSDKEARNKTHFLERLTTHDDMMMMRADIAELYGVTQEKVINLDSDTMVRESLKEGSVIKQGSRLSSMEGPKAFYEGKYDAIVKSISKNAESGSYSITLNQVVDSKIGMKMAGIHGGNKFTVGLFTKEGIVNQLGRGAADIEAVMNISPSKMPGDILTSQFNLMMLEMQTVGKLTKDQMHSEVAGVIRDMFHGNDAERIVSKMRIEQTLKDGQEIFSLVLPDNVVGTAYPADLFSSVEKTLQRLGVSSNVFKEVDGKKYYKGLTSLARMNVDDWTGVKNNVRVGLRELELLNNRKYLINTNIDKVVEIMEKKAFTEAPKFSKEGKQLLDVLIAGSGKKLTEDTPVIRTRGRLEKYATEMEFDKLGLFPTQSRALLQNELKNTVLDPNLFNGKAYYMELPETVKVGKYDINKVLMPSLQTRGKDGEIFASGVQQRQRQIFEAVKKYRDNITGVDDVSKKAFQKSRDMLNRIVPKYYEEVGNALKHSKGYINENALASRVAHSGYFEYRGVSPMDHVMPGIKKKLKEGHVLMSRHDFKSMLGGLEKSHITKIMEQAETAGFTGIGMRHPVKDFDALQPVMIQILGEKEESVLEQKYGKDALKGNIYTTVGTQIRHKADHDGDRMAILLPQIAGDKVKVIDQGVNSQMVDWFREEQKFTKTIGSEAIEKMVTKAKPISDILEHEIRDRSGQTIEDIVIGVEAKLQKQPGKFSNAATRFRRMTESALGSLVKEGVKTQTKGSNAYTAMTFFGSALEQAPISAKKLSEKLAGAAEDSVYRTYINSVGSLYGNLAKFNVDGIMEDSKTLGFFQDGNFIGAAGEGETFKSITGKYMTEGDIRAHLDFIKSHTPSAAYASKNSHLNAGLTQVKNGEDAIEFGYHIANPQAGDVYDYYTLDKMLKHGYGREDLAKGAAEGGQRTFDNAARKIKNEFYNSTVGGAKNVADFIHDGRATMHTIGDVASEGIKKSVNKVLSETRLGGALKIGAAVAGIWAFSAMTRGPNTDKQPVEAHPDRAPSSDGTYVNPAVYAGAPAGAGPTAMVAPRGGGYEKMNINIRGNTANGMSNQQMADLVSEEVRRQSPSSLHIRVSSQDDRENIDKQWLQDKFAMALKSGYVG